MNDAIITIRCSLEFIKCVRTLCSMTNCILSYDSSHFKMVNIVNNFQLGVVNANTELSESLILIVTAICLERHNFISLEFRIRSSLCTSRAMCAFVICSNSSFLHLVETANSACESQ